MPDAPPSPRWLRGDEALVFRTHHAALRATVRHAVRGPDVHIDDACAHAWLQFLRHQPERATAFAWLRTTAIRHAWHLNGIDRGSARLNAHTELVDPSMVVDDTMRLRAREALRAVAHLPERQRRYATLHAAGHTYDEISAATGATRTNVNKHLARARAQLRDAAS